MRKTTSGLLSLTIILILITSSSAQELTSDEEVDDIHARIYDIEWEIRPSLQQHQMNDVGLVFIDFELKIELWNPYDEELVSYGSSSCRWDTYTTIELEDYDVENTWKACTDDLSPREYPSGISNETEIEGVEIYNTSITTLPKGEYLFSPGKNDFSNKTDYYFGLNLTVVDDDHHIIITEDHPDNWGSILLSKSKSGLLEFSSPFILAMGIATLYAVTKVRRK